MGTSLIAALIMAGISTASSVGRGIASNISAKKASEAQQRVNEEQEKFTQESKDINRQREQESLSFQKNIAKQQDQRQKSLLRMQAEDLQEASDRQEAGIRGSILAQQRSGPMSSLERNEKNILRLSGGMR